MNERYLNPNMVTYQCQDCTTSFRVIQGSKQRFCEQCLLKRVRQGRPRKVAVIGDDTGKKIAKTIEKLSRSKVVGFSKDRQAGG